MDDGPSSTGADQTDKKRRRTWVAVLAGVAVAIGATVATSVTDRLVNEAADVVLDPSSSPASETATGSPASETATGSTTPSAEMLVASQEWPFIGECGALSIPIGTQDLTRPEVTWGDVGGENNDWQGRREARNRWLEAGGGPIGYGKLQLDLTAPKDVTLYVTDIKIDVFSRSESTARWAVPLEPGCGAGDVKQRIFFADLNQPAPFLDDLGVTDYGVSSGVVVPDDSFGPSFTISEKKPTEVVVVAASCTESVSWGLSIEYFADGENRVLKVGTEDHPFVSLAGDSQTQILTGDGSAHNLLGSPCMTKSDNSDDPLQSDSDYYPSDSVVVPVPS